MILLPSIIGRKDWYGNKTLKTRYVITAHKFRVKDQTVVIEKPIKKKKRFIVDCNDLPENRGR